MNIPYGKQDITDADLEAVLKTLKSDRLTQGPVVNEFETAVSTKCSAKYALATNSATSALHIACLSLDLGSNDELWTSPNTFVASANCAIYCDAKIDFVDIDPATYNICPHALEQKLIAAKKLNKLPKIVIPVHFSGLSCDMEEIHRLSIEYGFKIIEDASHAIGGSYKDFSIGSCKYSDITIFSFHPVKIITTGEGGMALTNDKNLAKKLELFRTHGITRDTDEMLGHVDGPWFYQQKALGFNYRITDFQASLGLSQLKRLDEYVKKRNQLAQRYQDKLKEFPVTFQEIKNDRYSAFHLFVINLVNEEDISNRKKIFEQLREAGVGVNVHYIPVHLHPFYASMGFSKGDFPNSENYYKSAITLPLHPKLTISEQDYVIDKLLNSISK
jgi:UDP-4-amino-4,6-dideoxy-N-acetyl-beta-L-altrosamine transaminase